MVLNDLNSASVTSLGHLPNLVYAIPFELVRNRSSLVSTLASKPFLCLDTYQIVFEPGPFVSESIFCLKRITDTCFELQVEFLYLHC